MDEQNELLDKKQPESELIAAVHTAEREIAAMERIEAGIAAIEKAHPVNLAIDVTTSKGMAEAIAARRAYREPRTSVESVRKAAKAPVLELGRQIDGFARKITERLLIGESNYDDQIKAQEAKVAAEKKAKEEAEAKRIESIRHAIASNFTNAPRMAFGKDANGLAEVVRMLVSLDPALVADAYAELLPDAVAAHAGALVLVRDMHDKAVASEAEAKRIEEERARQAAEAEKLRAEREAFEREQREARLKAEAEQRAREVEQAARDSAEREARRAEEERQRAERQKIEDERNALLAAQRAEADRLAAIERKRLDEEAEAARMQAAKEAAERQAKDEADRAAFIEAERKENAKRARAAKKLDAIQKAGPRLLEVLKALLEWEWTVGEPLTTLAERAAAARALIAELEAE